MSESTVIVLIVLLDVALLGFVAWMMFHPRHLKPHKSANEAATPTEWRPRFARDAEPASDASPLIEVEIDAP